MKKYQALLISSDGQDYVTDFNENHCDSIDDVWEYVNNMGSKWIFYPLCFVIRANAFIGTNQRILDCPDSLINDGFDLRGKSVKSAMQWIADNQPYIQMILS
jgi:hypothetical protein